MFSTRQILAYSSRSLRLPEAAGAQRDGSANKLGVSRRQLSEGRQRLLGDLARNGDPPRQGVRRRCEHVVPAAGGLRLGPGDETGRPDQGRADIDGCIVPNRCYHPPPSRVEDASKNTRPHTSLSARHSLTLPEVTGSCLAGRMRQAPRCGLWKAPTAPPHDMKWTWIPLPRQWPATASSLTETAGTAPSSPERPTGRASEGPRDVNAP